MASMKSELNNIIVSQYRDALHEILSDLTSRIQATEVCRHFVFPVDEHLTFIPRKLLQSVNKAIKKYNKTYASFQELPEFELDTVALLIMAARAKIDRLLELNPKQKQYRKIIEKNRKFQTASLNDALAKVNK